MKTNFTTLTFFVLFCLLSLGKYAIAQTAGTAALMEVKNCIQVSANAFEYDMFLTNTGTTSLSLRGYSWGLNPSATIATSSTNLLSHTFLYRSSLLANIPAVSAQYSNYQLRSTTVNAAPGLEVPLTTNVPILLGHMRVTYNSGPFPGGLNIPAWNASNPIQVVTQAGKTQCIATVIITPPGTNYLIFGNSNPTMPTIIAGLSTTICPLILNCDCAAPTEHFYNHTACESYTWPMNGVTYTQSGYYTSSVGGMCCNNPYIQETNYLNLTINNGTTSSSSITANETYTWDVSGQTYTQSGMYTATAIGTSGCVDNHILNLTIVHPFTIKFFIQGYLQSAAVMKSVRYNQGLETNAASTNVDEVTVKLHESISPYNVVDSYTGLLQTNGQIRCYFPQAVSTQAYFISVHHRNSIETWSANTITWPSLMSYDFTSAANKAYGANQFEVESGVWAFYNGDVNQDENINLLDISDVELDAVNAVYGYYSTDINGDGNIDLLDFTQVEENINQFIFSHQP